jgi:hypothetical protein
MSTAAPKPGFTLARGPYWLFLAAGIATASLTPLLTRPTLAIAWFTMAVVIIILVVAGRLRDAGASAWCVPIALMPLALVALGLAPGGDSRNSDFVTDRLLRSGFTSLLVIAALGRAAVWQ